MPNIGHMKRDRLTGLCIKRDGTPRTLNKNKGQHLKTPRKVSHDETGKICIRCKQHKPLTEFYKWRYAPRSYSSICKACSHLKSQKGWQNIKQLSPDDFYEYRRNLALLTNKKNHEIKVEVLSHYSNSSSPQCANPFSLHKELISDLDILTIDHIDGDGNKDRKDKGNHGSSGLYRKLRRLNYPLGYQVLCANCQMKKTIINKEHPRKYNHEVKP